MRAVPIVSLCLLAACMPTPGAEVSMNRARSALATANAPPPVVAPLPAAAPRSMGRSNSSIARDFLELAFAMESGRTLTQLSRFEGPVTVQMKGMVPANAATDLGRLLTRLRGEAGIDIREIAAGPASVTIEFIPRDMIRATYANVACFVVPGVSGWDEFRAARGTAQTDWTRQAERTRLSIFLPADSPAQEVRDCLHEELAQALGPLNDLYRLSDSIFNDDNFHNTLTGFDMLVLRAYYDPALRSGMTRDQVAARLPAILDRINPDGRGGISPGAGPTPREWMNLIEAALSGRASVAQRETQAQAAVAFARAQGWTDSRLALSYFALGRLTLARDPDAAMQALRSAAAIWRNLPGGEVHLAHVEMQLAAHALATGDLAGAASHADTAIPVVSRYENAALMATLMMIRAEALDRLGRGAEAQALRLDSAGWARYGFGSDEQVRARAAEIAALARRGSRG